MPDDSFKFFVLDQLAALPDVCAKAMFGGHGLYQGDCFFGILAKGRLYFRTDETSQTDYIARGMTPFTYEQRGKTMTMRYHEVPSEVIENSGELIEWALTAIQTRGA